MTPPRLSDHASEIGLLGWLGTGVLAVLIIAAFKGQLSGASALDVAAFLLVLTRIVEAVQKRWEQRSFDRTTAQLGASTPGDAATGKPDDPVHTVTEQNA